MYRAVIGTRLKSSIVLIQNAFVHGRKHFSNVIILFCLTPKQCLVMSTSFKIICISLIIKSSDAALQEQSDRDYGLEVVCTVAYYLLIVDY